MRILHVRKAGVGAPVGFTLIELLVVVLIVALLIGILLPVLSKARMGAKNMLSQSGERQLMVGYSVYQSDWKGALLWGFTYTLGSEAPVSTEVRLSTGTTFTNTSNGGAYSQEAARYPFRLAPYVAEIWSLMHFHRAQPLKVSPGDELNSPDFYSMSLAPAYGLNSFYVGGHGGYASGASGFGGFYQGRPNVGRHAVFRIDEVRSPATLVVFSEAKNMSSTGHPSTVLDGRGAPNGKAYEGTFYVRPPRFARPDPVTGVYPSAAVNWGAGPAYSAVPTAYEVSAANGIPSGWFADAINIGFMDGHVNGMTSEDLTDMRYWANRADSATDTDFAD